jgi:glycosyltransferase involved in cell wall biosynthesis
MKILQIAYHYPPMGGAAVQRALKFSKFLPEFGIEPVVLAAFDPDYIADDSLVGDIPPQVRVHRVEHRPLLQRLLAWRARRPAPADPRRPASAADSGVALALRGAARDLVLRSAAALQFPDDKAAWARKALIEGRRLVRSEGIELIFSSSPPASAHGLGARLAREFQLPWVADLRDLWTDNPGYAAPAWRRALDRRQEAAWLRQAHGVVTVTPSWQRLLAARVMAPVAFIPNGYDEADFAGLQPAARRDDAVWLVHTGTFYGPRNPTALLDGLALYLQSAGPRARALKVKLIGNMGSRFDGQWARFDLRFPGVVERRPYMPHRAALAELMAADALLLVVGGAGETGTTMPSPTATATTGTAPSASAASAAVTGWLPGKIFEYLRAAKPVLLLGPAHGDAADLVRRHSGGWIVEEGQPARLAEALHALVHSVAPAARPGAPAPATAGMAAGGAAGVGAFERRELARQLADFLRQCGEHR